MNHATIPTPAGPLTVVVNGDGAVQAAGFNEDPDRLPAGSHRLADLGDITKAVAAYLDGDLPAIDGIPVQHPVAGAFIASAWGTLRTIPPAAPVTYRQLAAAAGRPAAVRAAANACARNPVALLVPCHRVIRTDGGLGGYRWGLDVKRWLLHHEHTHGAHRTTA
jgi:methylated-DNA-[protein]-cysteine S-methyltransferase